MLICKLWIGKVKIVSEEWRESANIQFYRFGFYLQIIIRQKRAPVLGDIKKYKSEMYLKRLEELKALNSVHKKVNAQ